MARRPRIPRELTERPFSLHEARTAGLTLSQLKGKTWRRLGSQLYCWSGSSPDPWSLLAAWQRRLPLEAAFAGKTAAWLHGLDFSPDDPVEVAVPPSSGIRPQRGLSVRRGVIQAGDVVAVRGLRATSVLRTLLDFCARSSAMEALVAIDAAVALGLTDAAALGGHSAAMSGRAGAGRLRDLAMIAGPAESPMETRLRWLLMQAGLPKPRIQADLRDGEGRFVGRADLYYPAASLVVEYDGGNHRARLTEDNRRQNLLLNAGFSVLRFTAADMFDRPYVVVAQVRQALGAAPIRMRDAGRALGAAR